MKKIIVLTALSLMIAGPALAANIEFKSDAAPSAGTGVVGAFRTSKNVVIKATSAADAYTAASKHLNGDRAYAAASGDSKLYYLDSKKGDATPDVPADFTKWTAL